jgi:hypothetical protein
VSVKIEFALLGPRLSPLTIDIVWSGLTFAFIKCQ